MTYYSSDYGYDSGAVSMRCVACGSYELNCCNGDGVRYTHRIINEDGQLSLYYPDPATLYPARLADGWHIMDKFGKLGGPYASASEAWVVIHRESAAQNSERSLGRHPSYGEA